MRNITIIYLKWKLSNRVELFTNLGKLYATYDHTQIGVSRSQLNRRNIYEMYSNDTIELQKLYIK